MFYSDHVFIILFLTLKRRIVEELLNKVDVSEQHSSTTIPLQTQCIKGVTLGIFGLKQTKVGIPLIANHLSTCETSYWYNHLDKRFSTIYKSIMLRILLTSCNICGARSNSSMCFHIVVHLRFLRARFT